MGRWRRGRRGKRREGEGIGERKKRVRGRGRRATNGLELGFFF